MLDKMLENVRVKSPLVHNITNYVTVNDCANILLAIGASPIMADDEDEAEEVTSICDGLNINIGTLNSRTIKSMLIAGKKANSLGHPVVLDPVGVGVSKLRTDTAQNIVKEVRLSAIRGNISEIRMLAKGTGNVKGVDADKNDSITEESLADIVELAKAFSKVTGAVTAITGAIDVVSDKNTAYLIRNGCKDMAGITGAGCMLSSLVCAFISANPDNPLEATAAAVVAMGLAGETAKERMSGPDGSGSFRTYLIDAIYNMTPERLMKGAKYEVR